MAQLPPSGHIEDSLFKASDTELVVEGAQNNIIADRLTATGVVGTVVVVEMAEVGIGTSVQNGPGDDPNAVVGFRVNGEVEKP